MSKIRGFIFQYGIDNLIYCGLIALAVFLSIYLTHKRLRAFGHDLAKLGRFFIVTAIIVYPAALIGSRFPDMFDKPPWLWSLKRFVVQVWEVNTYTFHGGLLFVTVILLCLLSLMKFTSSQKWNIADTIFLYIPLCHPIGRASCLLLGCCWGKQVSLSIGGYSLDLQNPVPLYTIILLLIIFLILRAMHNYVYADKDRMIFRGLPTAFYFILYGFGRFLLEIIRTNPVVAWGLTQAQIVMLFFMFTGGLILFLVVIRYFSGSAAELCRTQNAPSK